ncbi:hypothetical protein LWF01_01225 [Saxibacter everestensis]|uniref:Uncharacterized protein n=1 Tax=Saxibacter everestensis TaxID=2909229 RepID=A0ABY8QVJ0_9MICO|nr:hypothetical protein LWF01_01225 [Brevibacteriaceae bacterium ZFBP1038]
MNAKKRNGDHPVLFLVICLVFVVTGAVIMIVDPASWLLGLTAVLFFGVGLAVAVLNLIAQRRMTSGPPGSAIAGSSRGSGIAGSSRGSGTAGGTGRRTADSRRRTAGGARTSFLTSAEPSAWFVVPCCFGLAAACGVLLYAIGSGQIVPVSRYALVAAPAAAVGVVFFAGGGIVFLIKRIGKRSRRNR